MPLKGRCHCGATQFEVTEAPSEVTACNCSICHKRGQLHAYYPATQFKLTTARDRVSTYQFGDYVGEHHHCAVCGCGTYSEFPDFSTGQPDYANPRVSVNARLFDVEVFDLASVPVKRVNGRADW
jgi:hypothetical protein